MPVTKIDNLAFMSIKEMLGRYRIADIERMTNISRKTIQDIRSSSTVEAYHKLVRDKSAAIKKPKRLPSARWSGKDMNQDALLPRMTYATVVRLETRIDHFEKTVSKLIAALKQLFPNDFEGAQRSCQASEKSSPSAA